MADSDYQKLEKRLKAVEAQLSNSGEAKKPKEPRKSSEYNLFMGKYISEQKKSGSTKSHKDLFADGAKAWKDHKESKK
jgi:hypothetical protein